MRTTSLRLALLLLFLASIANAQNIASFEKKVTVKKLANGLTLVVMERPEAPVFSFFTHVNVGAVQEPVGQTGLAHMFEHMAFKGTDKIGTTNFAAEKAALQKVESSYLAYRRARAALKPDEKQVAALKGEWEKATEAADKYVVSNEFSKILDQQGAVGVNAFTDWDETGYFYAFPENRLELWAYLESERFSKPVFREFYKERDVVYEERRMRTDSNPIGRLVEQFVAAAYTAHPYGRPVVGWPSDLEWFSATDAANFYKKYYTPGNLVVAVVGDVKASEVVPIVEKYFGRIPKGEGEPEPLDTVEPPQTAERTVTLHEASQPLYLEGYHRPNFRDPDDAVYDFISDLMSKGRTSRLYRALVRDKKIAAVAQGFSGFPGNKYPNLFAFFAVPTPGHNPKELADAIHAEIDRLKNEDITDEELQSVKTRYRADLIRGLADNDGLAGQLATTQAYYGDWRELFRQADRVDKVSKADVRRVASKVFTDVNRTVGVIENVSAAGAKGAK